MPKAVKISVSVSRTIQTAPYETVRVELSQEQILNDDEEAESSRVELHKAISSDLERFIKREARKYKKSEEDE